MILNLINFIKAIPGYYNFFKNYGYNGENMEFIIENYTEVLCNRTKMMSKPTYYARDVIAQLDNYYEKLEEE